MTKESKLDDIVSKLTPESGNDANAKPESRTSAFVFPAIETLDDMPKSAMKIRIGADGSWFYDDDPITRHGLLEMFSTSLVKHKKWFYINAVDYLVRIIVDDLPFAIVDIDQHGSVLTGKLNLLAPIQLESGAVIANELNISANNPIEMLPFEGGEALPAVKLSDGVYARFNRASFYRLVDLAEDGVVKSNGEAFSLV